MVQMNAVNLMALSCLALCSAVIGASNGRTTFVCGMDDILHGDAVCANQKRDYDAQTDEYGTVSDGK